MTDPSRDRPREHRRLLPHASSVAEARRVVRAALVTSPLRDAEPEGLEDLEHTAELCVSELVTNAVVHAGTDIDVSVHLYDGGLRVEVEDRSAHLPVPRHYSSLASTGRGLLMVDQLVTRWGVWTRTGAKTVWFELGEPSDVAVQDDVLGLPPGDVAIELRNVPLLLHAAWQVHAESLLRELLLVRLDADSTGELEQHAAASDAIALLERQINLPDLGQDPAAVMASAVEPLVSADLVTLRVPATSVGHFEVLGDLLEEATALADSGALLTSPTQPEVRDFRRWVCREVRRQAAGHAARAWDPALRYDNTPPAQPLDWDPGEVATAPAAVVAADDSGAIVAVSPAAARTLDWDPDELVGRRLVDIVPARFRQAHLAGVTLHLFAGRGPLLDSPVVVPALRRDGSEVMVTVLVRSRRMPRGRRLFTAELSPA